MKKVLSMLIQKIGTNVAMSSTNASSGAITHEPVMPKHMLNK